MATSVKESANRLLTRAARFGMVVICGLLPSRGRKAGLMLVCLLAALLPACSRKPVAGVNVDPALALLVPQDSVAAAGVKLDVLRETPIFKKYRQRPLPMAGEFVKRTGIDPQKDLWQILVVSNGKEVVSLLRGKFTETGGLEPKIEIPGANRYPYKGYTIIGSEQGGVAFTNSTTAVAGRLSGIRTIIDQRDAARGFPSSLAALVKTVPASSQIWGVTVGGAGFLSEIPLQGNLVNLTRLFAGVRTAMFGADLRKGAAITASIVCGTDKDAKQIHDAARAVIGLGRLNTPSDKPELLGFYDAIKVTQDGAGVRVSADIPEDLLEKFLAEGSLNRLR